jgi:hypothetical protein
MKKIVRFIAFLGFLALGCLIGTGWSQIAAPTATQVVTAVLVNPTAFTLAVTPASPTSTTQMLTISGTVSGSSGVPTGTVTVCDGGTGTTCTGGTAVATATLTSTGAYTCSESNPAAGTHVFTSHYSGDTKYAPSK